MRFKVITRSLAGVGRS